jgi:hypothetical protein
MRTVSLNSTTLKTATYRSHTQVLELEFCSGALYHYRGVCQSVYEQLLAAESKGRYYNQHIRNCFGFTKICTAGSSSNPSAT